MDEIGFDWDARKAAQNVRKHKVSFEEAATLFYDESAIEYFDPEHSTNEERFLMLGLSGRLRILVVSYCRRMESREIRIISARKATKKEEKTYIQAKQ